jgi:hypothetical protein
MIYKGINKALAGTKIFGASVTAAPCSEPYRVTENGSKYLRVAIVASTVTAGAGIAVKLQELLAGTWTDVAGKTVSVTGNGTFQLQLNPIDDKALLPLCDTIRVVITTGAGSAATINTVMYYG